MFKKTAGTLTQDIQDAICCSVHRQVYRIFHWDNTTVRTYTVQLCGYHNTQAVAERESATPK
jgi:hypothetical protein